MAFCATIVTQTKLIDLLLNDPEQTSLPPMSLAEWISLLACRYFCWRWSCNVLAYLAMWPIGKQDDPAKTQQVQRRHGA